MRAFRHGDVVVGEQGPFSLFEGHDRDVVGRLELGLLSDSTGVLADGIQVAVDRDSAFLVERSLGLEPLGRRSSQPGGGLELLEVGVDFEEEPAERVGRLVNDLLQVGPLLQQDVLRLSGVRQGSSHAQRHLEREPKLPGLEIVVVARRRCKARGTLLLRDQGIDCPDRPPGHNRLSRIEVGTEPVELVEGVEVQDRQELVPRDQELEFGNPDDHLLGHDIGLEREHLGHAGIPVGLEPSLGRRGDRDDPAAIGRGKTKDVAKLPLSRDDVGGLGHQVEPELFEPLGRFGHVGDGASADFELRLLTLLDFLGQLDRLLTAPELDVLLSEAPVLLFDRTNRRHDLRFEPPDGGIGIEPGDHDRSPVGLETDRSPRLAPRQWSTTEQGLGQAQLKVRRVRRRSRIGRAIGIEIANVMRHTDLGTGGRPLLHARLELCSVLVEDDREPRGSDDRPGRDRIIKRGEAMPPEQTGREVGVEGRQRLSDLCLLDRGVVDGLERAGAKGAGDARTGPVVQRRGLEATDRNALSTQ